MTSVIELRWSEVDPARWPFPEGDSAVEADRLLALEVLSGLGGEAAVLGITAKFAERHGAWSCGWAFSIGEGSSGGVVRSWCCVPHSMRGTPAQTAEKSARGLHEWRRWLEQLAALFDELAPRKGDVEGMLARAVTRILDVVAQATGAEDAWYQHAEQVLGWYLQRHGMSPADAAEAVSLGLSTTFQSWVAPTAEERERTGLGIAEKAKARVTVAMPDSLEAHQAARARVDWSAAPQAKPGESGEDGHRRFIDSVDVARSSERAERMRQGLGAARMWAQQGALLSFELIAQLHAIATYSGGAMRTTEAFAKGGAERYGFSQDLRQRFERCLDDADDAAVPLLGRAARLYLDVCFFHPFADGNARTARLAFDFVLAREGVVLREVRPLFSAPIPAGDGDAYSAFLRLLATLAG
ncbi:MAG: Fic family protein [Myxococcales bacterium]